MQIIKNQIKKYSKINLLVAGLISLFILTIPSTSLAAGDCDTSGTPATTKKVGSTTVKVDAKPAKPAEIQKCLSTNPIFVKLNDIVNFLAIGVGVVVTGAIVLGGIQYSMSGEKPESVSAAKKRISNALLALLAFIFMYAFLQWLVPGGVFG